MDERISKLADSIIAKSKKSKPDDKMTSALIEFFKKNPNPDDAKFHSWAESKGFNTHKVEAAAYALAAKFVKILTEGKAVEKGLTAKDVDPKELAMGKKVEVEHVNDPDIAERIALDHLTELPDYYTRLMKMEGEEH